MGPGDGAWRKAPPLRRNMQERVSCVSERSPRAALTRETWLLHQRERETGVKSQRCILQGMGLVTLSLGVFQGPRSRIRGSSDS